MKDTKIFSLVIACSFMACSNDYVMKQNIPAENFPASPERLILEKAADAYDLFYPENSRRSVEFSNEILCATRQKSRGEGADTLLYVVNAEGGQGFVVLGAPLEKDIILAVSDQGSISSLENNENEGLQMFLDLAQEYIENNSIHEISGPINPPIVPRDTLVLYQNYDSPADVGPRCTVHWGQSYPEGLFCPNITSGCVITAAVQAMSYFEIPTTIALTFNGAPQDSVAIDWASMKNYVRSNSWDYYNNYLSSDSTSMSHRQEVNLGLLCREIGKGVNANYGDNGTSSSIYAIKNYINSCAEFGVVMSNIVNGIPDAKEVIGHGIIYMRGSYANGNQGHAWIVDGYRYINRHVIVKVRRLGLPGSQYQTIEEYDEFIDYHHVNWGWNGNCDGYFNRDVYCVAQGELYDFPNTNHREDEFVRSFSYSVMTKIN